MRLQRQSPLLYAARLMTDSSSSSGVGMDAAIAHLRELGEGVRIPLPTEQKVDAIALAAGVSFPHDFRRFLLEASDVAYGILEPVNVDNFEEVLADALEIGVPDNLLPICEDNGDFYCVNTTSEAVIFYDHNGSGSECWSNIASWIEAVWIGEYQDMENDE
mmetsp:Transcript_12431/g.17355  ORF Transcript_12431/g.17355 Transcript_12431/m.17355 type:complete len:161 (-) Transcript_12431:1670-2152(-)